MKAAALIEILGLLDPEAEVVIADNTGQAYELREITDEAKEIVLWMEPTPLEDAETEEEDGPPPGTTTH